MTITLVPIDLDTNTFGDMITRVNQLVEALANNVVTAGGDPTNGAVYLEDILNVPQINANTGYIDAIHSNILTLGTGTNTELIIDSTTQLELQTNKGTANGYAPLDGNALIPTAYIPDVYAPLDENALIPTAYIPDVYLLSDDLATDADVRTGATNKVFTTDLIKTASVPVAIADAATVLINWNNFITSELFVTADRVLANPTNVQPGTTRTIRIMASTADERSIAFEANYKGPLPEDTVTNGNGILLFLYAHTPTEIHVTWKTFQL